MLNLYPLKLSVDKSITMLKKIFGIDADIYYPIKDDKASMDEYGNIKYNSEPDSAVVVLSIPPLKITTAFFIIFL
jgi:hypothetical protein